MPDQRDPDLSDPVQAVDLEVDFEVGASSVPIDSEAYLRDEPSRAAEAEGYASDGTVCAAKTRAMRSARFRRVFVAQKTLVEL